MVVALSNCSCNHSRSRVPALGGVSLADNSIAADCVEDDLACDVVAASHVIGCSTSPAASTTASSSTTCRRLASRTWSWLFLTSTCRRSIHSFNQSINQSIIFYRATLCGLCCGPVSSVRLFVRLSVTFVHSIHPDG